MLIRIGLLSERTGVPADVLRSWERRYGLITPERTAGGFRLYSAEDVARVEAMTALIASGLAASEAARQVRETSLGGPPGTLVRDDSPLAQLRANLHRAFRSFDDAALETAIDLLLSQIDLDTAIRDVILPALRALGDDWEGGYVSVGQEHFTVNLLRGRMMGLARGWDHGFGPRALLACPPREYHDLSLILFGLALRRRGWRITFLGADTPIAEVLAARRTLAPRLTILFSTLWAEHADLVPELSGAGTGAISLAGSSAGPIAAASGCRWLSGDPVTEAETLTQEFDRTSPPDRPGVRRR